MTRKQVAERLGKSLATVRRLEGVLLHPSLDGRGKAHFDDAEVEQLLGSMERGEVTLWQHMRGASPPLEQEDMPESTPKPCEECDERGQQLSRLRAELEEREHRHLRVLKEVRDELERERERHRSEQRELERDLRRFVYELTRA